tara:strand:- start:893 stop:1390 length:498 start_codon:yes stop_codon:yes gene_type:complete
MSDHLLNFIANANDKVKNQEVSLNDGDYYFDGKNVQSKLGETHQTVKVRDVSKNIELAQQQINDLQKSISDMTRLLYVSIETPKMKKYSRKVIDCETIQGVCLWHGTADRDDDDSFHFTIPTSSGRKSAETIEEAINSIYSYGYTDCARAICDVYIRGINLITSE